jgi:hypothetical protein
MQILQGDRGMVEFWNPSKMQKHLYTDSKIPKS